MSCRKCVTDGCSDGAIIVTDSDSDFVKEKLEIESDPHNTAQFFVDRFGEAPISDNCNKFSSVVLVGFCYVVLLE
ncbi:MAG TPA: hypothetical protein VJ869_04500 [Sphaerochaeta sp.]|nr:hypothetical protein [Sphaerochaeta sp.]